MRRFLHGIFEWVRRTPILNRLGWDEALQLGALLVLVLATKAFVEVASDVVAGDTKGYDEWIIRSLRRPNDPAVPIGPEWLRGVGLDITALGGASVVVLVIAAVAGFLFLQGRFAYAWLVIVSSSGGLLLNTVMKSLFGRERPSIVPHLREVSTASFPSGHAMLSAVVYLTLGALLARIARGHWTKMYCLGVAVMVTFLVGASRVYLGVHYPSDVLAGWAAGLAWAMLCLLVARWLQRRGMLRRKPTGEPTAGAADDGG